MRGANMSVAGREVVKRLATGVTGERVFSDAFFVRFQVTSKVFLFPKLLVAASTFVRFLSSMNTLVSD